MRLPHSRLHWATLYARKGVENGGGDGMSILAICSRNRVELILEAQGTMAGWDCIHVAWVELEDVMEAETIRARVAHLEPEGMHLRWHRDQAMQGDRLGKFDAKLG